MCDLPITYGLHDYDTCARGAQGLGIVHGVKVTVVLGAGGARGYAHLGVIEELRSRDHEVVAIAGTSMGALVGGLAAAGRDVAFADWVRTLTQRSVLRLMDPARLSAPGAVQGNRLVEKIDGILGELQIEDLPIPFTAVAADLTNRREVWFQRGPLTAAIRASIAIPGALTPVGMGDRLLVDGGILNPVPMEPVLAVESDFTLAVDLSGRSHSGGSSPVLEKVEVAGDTRSWLGRIGFAARDRDGESERSIRRRAADAEPGAFEVMLKSFETMQETIARYRMAANPPDVLVEVPARSARIMEFHRAKELIELGRRLAAQELDSAGY